MFRKLWARSVLPSVPKCVATRTKEPVMANQQDSSGKQAHVADDKAGKGIMSRVNAASDLETDGVESASEDPQAKPSGAASPQR
jgi:hypothetical protein